MKKNLLHNCIKKVFLDLTDVEHFVFFDSGDNKFSFKSLDTKYSTTVMSLVTMNYMDHLKASVIIKEPDLFLKCLDIADDDVTLQVDSKIGASRIYMKDGSFESEIVVADPSFVPSNIIEKKNTEVEEPISYDVTIDVNADFVEKFVKARKANRSDTVSIWTKDRQSTFQLGDSNNFSNKIKFSVEMEGIFDMDKLVFSSVIIQTILERNKKGVGKIRVEPSGLMKLEFVENIDGVEVFSTYFMVANDSL